MLRSIRPTRARLTRGLVVEASDLEDDGLEFLDQWPLAPSVDQRIIDELIGHQAEALRRRYRHPYAIRIGT
jgi:hypothetical protein